MKRSPKEVVDLPGHLMQAPVDSLRMNVRQRERSPLNDVVWKLALLVAAGSLLTLLMRVVPGPGNTIRGLLSLAVAGTAWALGVRLLLTDSRWVRFWRVWLLLSVISLFLSGSDMAGRIVAISFATVFLLVRRYRPYQHLSSIRRAQLFLLGVAMFVALLAAPGLDEPGGWFDGVLVHGSMFASTTLAIFWGFTLLNLFFGMRLHFLRLRPKLAVTALLFALVPLTLLFVLASVALFGALGGSRASQGGGILEDWSRIVDREPRAGTDIFDSEQVYEVHLEDQAVRAVETSGGPAPEWVSGLIAALDSTSLVPADTTLYVRSDDQLWLWRIRPTSDGRRIQAFEVGDKVVKRLSGLLGCEATLHYGDGLKVTTDGGGIHVSTHREDDDHTVAGAPTDEDPEDDEGTTEDSQDGFSMATLVPFGASLIDAIKYDKGAAESGQFILTLRIPLADLAQEFISEENPFNLAIVVALSVVAAGFLILEALALFFGLRITSGITSAVRSLHRSTEQLARGDLSTYIELPNEDEFGDLAASFNEMTRAIRVGQDQAVQRERLEQELLVARRIQQRLLPREMPRLPGFQVAGTSRPSRQVGGDYFDFLSLPDDSLGIAVGDVSGKGIPAALLMSNLHACLHGQVIHKVGVSGVVERVNDLLAASTESQMFVTFFYGELDGETDTFTSVNAGHDPPILCHPDGTTERLRDAGLVLGMLPEQVYRESRTRMFPGDVLVLFTDGVTEAMGPNGSSRALDEARAAMGYPALQAGEPAGAGGAAGQIDASQRASQKHGSPDPEEEEDDVDPNFFGEENLIEIVQAHVGETADQIQDAILQAVSEHAHGVPQMDDITVVVIKKV